MSKQPDYNHILTADTVQIRQFGACRLERRSLGELYLPSGRIVANDPFAFFQTDPFTRAVKPGRYPVTICIAHLVHKGKTPDQRIAYAVLHIQPADQLPVRWEMAVLPNQDVKTLKAGYFFGYGVDAGTGAFMDADTATLIEKKLDELPFEEAERFYQEPLADAMETTYIHTRSYGNYIVDAATGLNVVAFSSGWGDGSYPSYWGLDTTGEVICLLTDFHVV